MKKQKTVKKGKYVIKLARNGEFYWVLKAPNGKVIETATETYKNHQGVVKSILSAQKNFSDKSFERHDVHFQYASKPPKPYYYFLHKANNGEWLGKSQYYKSKSAREKGIQAIIKWSFDADIIGLNGLKIKR